MAATLCIGGTLQGVGLAPGAPRAATRYRLRGMNQTSRSARLQIGLLALVVVATALLAATALGSSSKAVGVSAQDDFFDPEKVKIGQGEKVEWTNDGKDDHTVKFKGKPDKVIAPGESTSVRFKQPGRFKYHCTLHDGMTGKVIAGDV